MISDSLRNKRGEIGTLLGVIGISFLLALVVATQQIRNTVIQQKSSAQTVSTCTTYCVGIGADSGYCPTNNVCSANDKPSTYSCSKTSTCCCVYNPVPTSTPKPTATPTKIPTPTPTPYIYAECLKECERPGYDMGVCAAKGAACPAGTYTHSSYVCSTNVACCCSFLPQPSISPSPTITPTATKTPTPTPYIYAECLKECERPGYDMGVCAAKGAACPAGTYTHSSYVCSTNVACCCSYLAEPTATPTPTPVCTDPDGENNSSTNFVIAGKTTVSQWSGTAMQNVDYYDACTAAGLMTEYHCLNNNIAYTTRACANGYSCSSGACKANPPTATPTAVDTPTPSNTPIPSATPTPTSVCTDPDGENNNSQNFATAGTTTVKQWNGTAMQTINYVDKCVTEGILENFCLNGDIAYYRGPCRPDGTSCVSGVCKPSAATATPTATQIPTPTFTKTPTPTATKTPTPTMKPGAACSVSINTSALDTNNSIVINSSSSVSSALTPASGYTAVSVTYVIDTQVPASLVLSGTPYTTSTSPYKMTLKAGSITGTARITARGTVKNTTGTQSFCDAQPITVTIVNAPTATPTAIKTPTPTKTPTPVITLTPIATATTIPGVPCARKNVGDADCKADNRGKWTSLVDFEIWRSENFAHCRFDNLSACGPDADGDGNAMDANFNYPNSGNLPNEQNAVVDIVDFNIWLLKGFNPENGIK